MRSEQSEGERKSEIRNGSDCTVTNAPLEAKNDSGRQRSPDSTAFDRDEQRKIRRLQLMMDVVMSVISQDHSLSVDEAAEMIADSKKAALAMFPDKELAYNLLYKPRLQRLMRERFRIQ